MGQFKRPQSIEAIAMFAALQTAIEALDRAIDDEPKIEDRLDKDKYPIQDRSLHRSLLVS
jgi:hypothetical protein